MDHNPSSPDTNSWVDDRMANLDPAPEWNPDAERALDRLTQRKPAFNSQWMRLGMTATILAATVLVLVLLPWRRLWTPETATAPKAVATVAAKTGAAPQENPATKPPAQPANGKVLPDLPDDSEKDASQYLAESSPTRLPESSSAQAAPTEITPPVVIHKVTPEYSQEAKQAKIQGTIELSITVKADGTVQFESYRKTLGYGLDEKAREAIEQWLFTPGQKNGIAVDTLTTVSMTFSLK